MGANFDFTNENFLFDFAKTFWTTSQQTQVPCVRGKKKKNKDVLSRRSVSSSIAHQIIFSNIKMKCFIWNIDSSTCVDFFASSLISSIPNPSLIKCKNNLPLDELGWFFINRQIHFAEYFGCIFYSPPNIIGRMIYIEWYNTISCLLAFFFCSVVRIVGIYFSIAARLKWFLCVWKASKAASFKLANKKN